MRRPRSGHRPAPSLKLAPNSHAWSTARHGQVLSGQAAGEPEVVADQELVLSLPTGQVRLQYHRTEPLGRRVDRGRQAREARRR